MHFHHLQLLEAPLNFDIYILALDGVSGATPLAQLKAGKTLQVLPLFFGTIQGTIGEVSVYNLFIIDLFYIFSSNSKCFWISHFFY